MNEQEALDLCAEVVRIGRAAGADEIEAYLELSTSTNVRLSDGDLEGITSATARGIGVRAIVDGGLGFACGAALDPAGREDLAMQAIYLAREATPEAVRALPDPEPLSNDDLNLYDVPLAELSAEEMAEVVARGERASRAVDTRVVGTHIAHFRRVVERVAIANSRGIAASVECTRGYLSLSVIARDGQEAERGYASGIGRLLSAIDPEEVGQRAGRRALASLGGTVLPTRRGTVVMEPEVVSELLRGLAQALSGDAVVKGRSLFAARPGEASPLGSAIGAALVDLVDEGRRPGASGTLPWDGEGVPSRETPLIEGGVLRGFLHNTESGRRAGAASTGNGTRGSYRSLPEVGQTNLVLRPGSKTPAAIVAGVDDGLYVVSTRNVGGISPVSGDYSVGASGRRIVRGELAEPISGVTLAAPMLELLRNVREIGSDLRWLGGQGGYVGVPTVRIDDVMIGGR